MRIWGFGVLGFWGFGVLDKGDVMYDVCAFKIGWEAPIERVRKLSGNVKEEQTPPDKTEKQKQND